MKKQIHLIAIILSLLVSTNATAKKKKIKFGKIDKVDLEASICPIDSNAHAYYIMDKGSTDFIFTQSSFQLSTKRHFRIKILDESALNYATISIPLYSSSRGSDERVSKIKATTYNLEDGKMTSTDLDKKDIIRENTSKNWKTVKFALPNVKAGSVIEVSYNVFSDFLFNLNGWQFQYKIPVLKTEYRVEIPEYYIYKQYPHGYISYQTERSEKNQNIHIKGEPLSFSTEVFNYMAKDVPAFPEGRNLTTINNYISHVEFELEGVNYPYEPYKSYTSTWLKISEELLESESFGVQLKRTRCLKDLAATLKTTSNDPMVLSSQAFSYIKSKIKWNKLYSFSTSQSISKTVDKGIGNSGDINLALVCLLRELEIESYPVVLSTRNNGFLNQYQPKLSQLNYVIASCVINDQIYLLDATNIYSEVNMLPTRCLNGKGLLVMEEETKWVSLSKDVPYSSSYNYVMSIDDSGDLCGFMKTTFKDYGAYSFRNDISNYPNEDKYMEGFEEANKGIQVDSFKIENVDSTNSPIHLKINIHANNMMEKMGDLLMISPMFYEAMSSNPLKLEERLYPVEYYYPSNQSVRSIITIPVGYQVESLPQSIQFTSTNGKNLFKYRVLHQGNMIMVQSTYKRGQILFPFNEYDELKFFFETIVKTQNEKIVLKKI